MLPDYSFDRGTHLDRCYLRIFESYLAKVFHQEAFLLDMNLHNADSNGAYFLQFQKLDVP